MKIHIETISFPVTIRYNRDSGGWKSHFVKKETITVSIRKATKQNAEVVFQHRDEDYPGQSREYRMFENQLYCRSLQRNYSAEDGGFLPLPHMELWMQQTVSHCFASKRQAKARIAEESENFLVLDDEVWEKAGEPRYCIYLFGLGHNHGGTYLRVVNQYKDNIPNSRYFSALAYKQAVQTACRIASARGDTDSLEHMGNVRIDVRDPGAVHLHPMQDAGPGDLTANSLEALCETAPESVVIDYARACS
jgi:hypothetical protein